MKPDLVLPSGTRVLFKKDCYEDRDEDEPIKHLYIKGKIYISHEQGFIKDEAGVSRQWKKDWFTLTPEFNTYFCLIT